MGRRQRRFPPRARFAPEVTPPPSPVPGGAVPGSCRVPAGAGTGVHRDLGLGHRTAQALLEVGPQGLALGDFPGVRLQRLAGQVMDGDDPSGGQDAGPDPAGCELRTVQGVRGDRGAFQREIRQPPERLGAREGPYAPACGHEEHPVARPRDLPYRSCDGVGVVLAALRGPQIRAHREQRRQRRARRRHGHGAAQRARPGRPAPDPVERRAHQQGEADGVREDIAVDVQRPYRGQQDEQYGREDQQGERERPQLDRPPRTGSGTVRHPGAQQAQQRRRHEACRLPEVGKADPVDLSGLRGAEGRERQQPDAHTSGRDAPLPDHRARQPGAEHRRAMGEQGHDRQLVEQTGDQQDGGVRAPAEPAPPADRGQQQPGAPGDQRTHQRVRTSFLRVPLHRRDQRKGQPGQYSGAWPGERPPDEGDPHRRHGHRQDGRQSQGRLGAVPQREHPVHEQVVETVHGVGVAQRVPDLSDAPVRHLVGDRLVAPQRVPAVDSPQPEEQRHGERTEDEGDRVTRRPLARLRCPERGLRTGTEGRRGVLCGGDGGLRSPVRIWCSSRGHRSTMRAVRDVREQEAANGPHPGAGRRPADPAGGWPDSATPGPRARRCPMMGRPCRVRGSTAPAPRAGPVERPGPACRWPSSVRRCSP